MLPKNRHRRLGSSAQAHKHLRTWILISLVCSASTGCATLGPRTIRGDRFNYNQAGAQSANEQLLLNIVRLRYGVPIYWLEIGSMLSQYTFQAGAEISAWEYDVKRWESPALRAVYGVRPDPVPTDTWGANLGWLDRPTITYVPLQGEAFAKRVMSPIPAATVIYMAQSGWSIDRVFECCVQQVNGIQNKPIHDVAAGSWVSDIKFRTVTALLKKIQDSGHLQLGLEYDFGKGTAYLYLPADMTGIEEEARELGKILGIPENAERIKLTEAAVRRTPDEFAVQTRSLLGTMYALSQSFMPPPQHLEDGQVPPSFEFDTDDDSEDGADEDTWLHVKHSRLPVLNASAQVYYNGYWFYISKSDWRSKRTFALVTYLFSLQATDTGQKGPVVTVGAGGG